MKIVKQDNVIYMYEDDAILRIDVSSCNKDTILQIPSYVDGVKITTLGSDVPSLGGFHIFNGKTPGVLKSVIIPNEVKTIKPSFFADITLSEPLNIPDSVTYVSAGAFRRARIPVVNWGKNCPVIPEYCFLYSHVQEVQRLDGVTRIEYDAFEGSDIRVLNLRNSFCTEIQNDAFGSSLIHDIFPSSFTPIDIDFKDTCLIYDSEFERYSPPPSFPYKDAVVYIDGSFSTKTINEVRKEIVMKSGAFISFDLNPFVDIIIQGHNCSHETLKYAVKNGIKCMTFDDFIKSSATAIPGLHK